MKEQDVRIGMKVRTICTGGGYVVLSEKDYRTMYGNVYTLKNIKTGGKITINACDFERYIDAIEELSNNTEKERQEEEIQKAFEEFRVSGTPYSSFTIFEAGYHAGMKRGDR